MYFFDVESSRERHAMDKVINVEASSCSTIEISLPLLLFAATSTLSFFRGRGGRRGRILNTQNVAEQIEHEGHADALRKHTKHFGVL